MLCSSLSYHQNKKLIYLDDQFIKKICLLQPRHKSTNIENINAQLIFCKMIKEQTIKIETSKKIYENLLSIDNTYKNQRIILNDWKSLKQNPEEIVEMTPKISNNKLGIFLKIEQIPVIDINCHKIASDFSTKHIHTFNCSKKIIEKFQIQFPNSIIFHREKENNDGFLIFMKNKDYADKMTVCMEYFIQTIASRKSWFNKPITESILNADWNCVLLAHKLDKSLSDEKKSPKKNKNLINL